MSMSATCACSTSVGSRSSSPSRSVESMRDAVQLEQPADHRDVADLAGRRAAGSAPRRAARRPSPWRRGSWHRGPRCRRRAGLPPSTTSAAVMATSQTQTPRDGDGWSRHRRAACVLVSAGGLPRRRLLRGGLRGRSLLRGGLLGRRGLGRGLLGGGLCRRGLGRGGLLRRRLLRGRLGRCALAGAFLAVGLPRGRPGRGAFFAGAFFAAALAVRPWRVPSWRQPSSRGAALVAVAFAAPWRRSRAATFLAAAFAGAVALDAGAGGRLDRSVATATAVPAARPGPSPVAGLRQRAGLLDVGLERRAGAEARRLRLGDAHRGAGVRVAAGARRALDPVERPEAGDRDLPTRARPRGMIVSSTASRASLAALRLPSRFSSSLSRSALFTVDQLQLGTASGWRPTACRGRRSPALMSTVCPPGAASTITPACLRCPATESPGPAADLSHTGHTSHTATATISTGRHRNCCAQRISRGQAVTGLPARAASPRTAVMSSSCRRVRPMSSSPRGGASACSRPPRTRRRARRP